ncbi:unnamed protein product [Sympodiomycopsis kandeliae]
MSFSKSEFFRALLTTILRSQGLPEEVPEDLGCHEVFSMLAQGEKIGWLVTRQLVRKSTVSDAFGSSGSVAFYLRESAPLSADGIAVLEEHEKKRGGMRKWLEAGDGSERRVERVWIDEDEDEVILVEGENDDDDEVILVGGGSDGDSNGDGDGQWKERYVGFTVAGQPWTRLQDDLGGKSSMSTRWSRFAKLLPKLAWSTYELPTLAISLSEQERSASHSMTAWTQMQELCLRDSCLCVALKRLSKRIQRSSASTRQQQ